MLAISISSLVKCPLSFKFSALTDSEKNYFKCTEHNLFLVVEVVVMNHNYYMASELLGSFQGLPSVVRPRLSLSALASLLSVHPVLAAVPLPIPSLVYCFYETIVNKPVRIVFEREQ